MNFQISIDLKLFPLPKRNSIVNFIITSKKRYNLENQIISINSGVSCYKWWGTTQKLHKNYTKKNYN